MNNIDGSNKFTELYTIYVVYKSRHNINDIYDMTSHETSSVGKGCSQKNIF